MDIRILPGSPFLQACFCGLAVVIVLAAAWLVRSSAVAAGDPPAEASRLQRRFVIGALVLSRLMYRLGIRRQPY